MATVYDRIVSKATTTLSVIVVAIGALVFFTVPLLLSHDHFSDIPACELARIPSDAVCPTKHHGAYLTLMHAKAACHAKEFFRVEYAMFRWMFPAPWSEVYRDPESWHEARIYLWSLYDALPHK